MNKDSQVPDNPARTGKAENPPALPQQPESTEDRNSSAIVDPTRYGDWEKGGRCIDF